MLNTQPVEPDHLLAEGHVESLKTTVDLLTRLLDEAKQQLKEQKAEAKAQLERSLADKDEIIKLYKLQLGSMQEARNK
ncbi:hypothetical protein H0H87_002312 [Tephrocybe sp. NHM501043]|nr:hypothetical protein H0H87_002312 [Tephrocybe sp. NHM501043]